MASDLGLSHDQATRLRAKLVDHDPSWQVNIGALGNGSFTVGVYAAKGQDLATVDTAIRQVAHDVLGRMIGQHDLYARPREALISRETGRKFE